MLTVPLPFTGGTSADLDMAQTAENNDVYESHLPIVANLIGALERQQHGFPPSGLENYLDGAVTAEVGAMSTTNPSAALELDDSGIGDQTTSDVNLSESTVGDKNRSRFTQLNVRLDAITHLKHLRMGSDQSKPLSVAHIRNVIANIAGASMVRPRQVRKWWKHRDRFQEIHRRRQVTAPPVPGHSRCGTYDVELKKRFVAAVTNLRENVSLTSPFTAGEARALAVIHPELASVQLQLLRIWRRNRESIAATKKSGLAMINRSSLQNRYTTRHPQSWNECVRKEIKTFIDNSVYLSVRMSSLCAFRCAQIHAADFNYTVDLNHYFVHPATMWRYVMGCPSSAKSLLRANALKPHVVLYSIFKSMGLKVQRKKTSVHKSAREALTQHCMLLDQLREIANVANATGGGPFVGNISRAAICNAGKTFVTMGRGEGGRMRPTFHSGAVGRFDDLKIAPFFHYRRKSAFPHTHVWACLGTWRFARRTGYRRRGV